ncbi:response regulator transcription factor [bacterium]|nr:MAG: response regulator transcription factor [bacterium]
MNNTTDIRILLVDDHKIVRDGIRSLLIDHEHIHIVGEASNGKEAIAHIEKGLEPDVILMDINMPEMDGILCTKTLKELGYDCKVLALTMLKEDQHIRSMVESGASGYLLKDAGEDELVNAIENVAEGKPYFSDEATAALLRQFVIPKKPQHDPLKGMDLTEREIEVLKLITDEFTNQEIADKLFISVRTVDAHRRNLMEKIGAKNMAGLVRFAIEKGYV